VVSEELTWLAANRAYLSIRVNLKAFFSDRIDEALPEIHEVVLIDANRLAVTPRGVPHEAEWVKPMFQRHLRDASCFNCRSLLFTLDVDAHRDVFGIERELRAIAGYIDTPKEHGEASTRSDPARLGRRDVHLMPNRHFSALSESDKSLEHSRNRFRRYVASAKLLSCVPKERSFRTQTPTS
jgi:hypothetical protein